MEAHYKLSLLALLLGAVALSAWAQQTQPTTDTTTGPAASAIPDATIREMVELMVKKPEATTPDEAIKSRAEYMDKVLTLGKEAEQKYPNAPNLAQVHRLMLQAGDYLVKARRDDESKKQLNDLVDRILKSSTDVEAKVTADFVRTMHSSQENGKPVEDAPKQLQAFVDRYKDTKAAGTAYAFAAGLAEMLKLDDIKAQYVKVLKDKYAGEPGVKNYLRHMGEYNDVGQPFKATLTRLDGKKLNLPADLKGEVVVVDFWASWCPPCRESVGELKELYKKYKDQGVEFVGVSLDRTKDDATKFIQSEQMSWIQTYDGEQNPTAIEYGIESIPTVFVLDKEGKIVSTKARESLEATIKQALEGEATTQPAKQ